jgi:hypothetical protein
MLFLNTPVQAMTIFLCENVSWNVLMSIVLNVLSEATLDEEDHSKQERKYVLQCGAHFANGSFANLNFSVVLMCMYLLIEFHGAQFFLKT